MNFTTLGYGDLVMTPEHRLLGAMEAVNGVLMCGVTTGVLFTVMQMLMRRRLEVPEQQLGSEDRSGAW